MHFLREQGVGQEGTPRQQKAFLRQGGYRSNAITLWQIPDVELRAWVRQQILVHPSSQLDLSLLMVYLGFRERRPNDRPFQTYAKSLLWKLFKRYPDPRALVRFLRAHEKHLPLAPNVLEQLVTMPPAPATPDTASSPEREERRWIAYPFSVVSPGFVQRSLPPPSQPPALPAAPLHVESELERAYQPVHEAIQAALSAIERLTASYSRAWLQWDCAQDDLANLRVAITPE